MAEQKLFHGTLIVRQVGGLEGTDEVQISHDGTNATLESKDGAIVIPSDLTVNGTFTLDNETGILKASSGTVTSDAGINDLDDVSISSPSADEVLAYDGTNWVNQASSGGGGDPLDHYFNPANTVNYRVDLNSTSLTNAYQYTGTGRAVVTGIHVANVDGTNEADIDAIINDNSAATDYYIAKALPLPADTSLELLKRPKVLEPSDQIKLQASAASDLQATITVAPFDDNSSLFNKFLSIGTSGSLQTVYTESGTNGSVIESILLANDESGTNGVEVDLVLNDGTNDTYLTYTMNIPAGSTVEVCETPKHLPNSGTIKIQVSNADRCDVSISGRQIT